MPCKQCGGLLLSEPDLYLVCPNCSSRYKMFSKEDTKRYIQKSYNFNVEKIRNLAADKDLVRLMQVVHEYRDIPHPIEISKFFELSGGLKILYDEYKKGNGGDESFTDMEVNFLMESCSRAYLDLHFLYLLKFDAVRLVELSNGQKGTKFTEKWVPIYKRQILMGNWPPEPDPSSDLALSLFSEHRFRTIFLEDLHEMNPEYASITEVLEELQKYHFRYPWDEYLRVRRDKKQIDFFLNLVEKLMQNKQEGRDELDGLDKKEHEFMEKNWIYTEGSSQSFPFILELDGQYLIPHYILTKISRMYELFSTGKKKLFGDYRRHLSYSFEDRVYKMLQIYNMDFHSPPPERLELKRYDNPYKKGHELFDVGVIDHNCKLIYIIECKNRSNMNLKTYDQGYLNDEIMKEFEEFRDRDLPDVEKIKVDWELEDYEVVAMFYHLVPLFGELKDVEQFKLLDGIYVIQTYTEIGAIMNMNFHLNHLTFYQVYNVPEALMKFIKGNITILDSRNDIKDLGSRLREPEEYFFDMEAKIYKVDENDFISELWVVRDQVPRTLNIDIPPELWPEIREMDLNEGDKVRIVVYRHGPFSLGWLLGSVRKL